MTYSHQPANIKVCPECGTNLIRTARRCAVCGYCYSDEDLESDANAPEIKTKENSAPRERLQQIPRQMPHNLPRPMPGTITINLPGLIGLVLLILVVNALVVMGLQKRGETKILVDSAQATATYIATTYVSPTPAPTATRTPGPPTETSVVDIEYTVVSGDSCLSIVKHFNIDYDSLVRKNDLDCSLLKIGTVLRIPPPTPTPEPTGTEPGPAASTPAP